MVVMFTGWRKFNDVNEFEQAVRDFEAKHGEITHVIIGGDKYGLDGIAYRWARNRRELPHTVVPARWNQHGRAAGPHRNTQMVKIAKHMGCGHCIAFPHPEGSGTQDTMEKARSVGIHVTTA